MFDAIILSDLHLGSDVCQARALTRFLEAIQDGETPTARLILNGDVFDSIDFRRLQKHHWKALSLLRKLTKHTEVIWLVGNHDGPAEIISALLGITIRDDYILASGGRRILFLHGHIFDEFLDRHPLLCNIADSFYRLLQRMDASHTLAKLAKKRSKTFLRSTQKVQARSLSRAKKLNCDAVCCGHTHLALVNTEGGIHYYNSGCWTEKPCHFLTVTDGQIDLHPYRLGLEDPVEHASSETTESVGI